MIWLVDDDVEDLDLFQEALQRNGYSGGITLVMSGTLVMDMLRLTVPQRLPSVVILDLNMHTKSGFDVLKDMKADAVVHGIPVIILSGSCNAEDEATCLKLGCERYWKKPNTMPEYDVMANHLRVMF